MQRAGTRFKAFRPRRSLVTSPREMDQHCEQAVLLAIEPWMDEGKPEPSDGDGVAEVSKSITNQSYTFKENQSQ